MGRRAAGFAPNADSPQKLFLMAKLTDQELERINKYALRPLRREEVFVWRGEIVNGAIDRHLSRFPVPSLRTIARMLPGKPLLVSHNHDQLPIGKFFGAEVQGDGDRAIVHALAYMVKTPELSSLISLIEGGVVSGTSIGFAFSRAECSICGGDFRTCSHTQGKEYDVNGKPQTCHYLMIDVTDVFEASLVSIPSQRTEILDVLRSLKAHRNVQV